MAKRTDKSKTGTNEKTDIDYQIRKQLEEDPESLKERK